MAELMKGQKWRDRKKHMSYPAWAEHKMDEIRVHVKIISSNCAAGSKGVEFLSYAGKPLHNFEYYKPLFLNLHELTGYREFDCGFEVNGNFNDSYRWVRSSKGIPEDLHDVDKVFYLFDLPELTGHSFSLRSSIRQNTAVMGVACDIPMYVPVGYWVNSEEEVEDLFHKVVKQGIEGLMVKSLDHEYIKGTRSNGWLKVKPEDDADGVITHIIEAISEDGTPLGRAGSLRIQVEDGSVATPHGIAHELGRDMWQNPEKYLGQWAEFKFMERDRQGGYRHPVFHRLREAK